MSEELNQAVPETSAPEVVPPVRASESDDPALLKNKLELVTADRQSERNEKRALQKQLEDAQRKLSERKQADLIEKEDYKGLHADLKTNYDSVLAERDALQQQLELAKVERQQDQIKANATNLFAQSGVNAPDHLMKILGDNLRLDENGAVVILSGGVQVPLNQHIQNLKSPGSGFEMFFSGTQARGMSAVGSTSNAAGQGSWSSMSFSERLALEVENPEAAAQLKAQG